MIPVFTRFFILWCPSPPVEHADLNWTAFLLLFPKNSVQDTSSARIRISSDLLNISMVVSCLCSDLLNNCALWELEAWQENVWSRDLLRNPKLQKSDIAATHKWNTAYFIHTVWVGHVPPHNSACIQERYKSNRQPILQGHHISRISSFTWWRTFSSYHFSYITPSQLSRASWAPRLQKIH